MRILTVSHFYEGHGGGIERVAGQLCRQFNHLGATAVWAASDSDVPPSGIEAVPLACIDPLEKLTGLPMPIPGLRAFRELRRAILASDAVIIHDALYATSILAMLLAKRCGKRVILVQHIAGIPFRSAILRAIIRACNAFVTRPMLRVADERVFISDVVRRDLMGAAPQKLGRLLFNGVDTQLFHPAVGGLAAAKPSRILFVGRFVEKKGLNVVRALAASRPDLEILFAGSGPIAPAEWKLPNIRDLGPQTAAQLAELYRSVDLLLLPSVGEGFPLVIQEAMASGLPVICGQPAEQADPMASKWLRGVAVDLAQPEQSAERISQAVDTYRLSEMERTEMASYAHRTYNWASMATHLLTLARAT